MDGWRVKHISGCEEKEKRQIKINNNLMENVKKLRKETLLLLLSLWIGNFFYYRRSRHKQAGVNFGMCDVKVVFLNAPLYRICRWKIYAMFGVGSEFET